MTNYLILDVECTTKAKGSPFHKDNRLCLVGLRDKNGSTIYDIEYSAEPYSDKIKEIVQRIEAADELVGFNIKFDLHWIRRYANHITFPRVWDCQLGEFILSNQTSPYPSLDESCRNLSIHGKSVDIATEYWKNGIDTPDIPLEELLTYLEGDLSSTESLYLKRQDSLANNQLFRLQCSDLLVLEEMEWNGMRYDITKSLEEGLIIEKELNDVDTRLHEILGMDGINPNSPDHISSVLYGGSITMDCVVPTQRTLKDGRIKHGSKKGFRQVIVPRLVDPIDGSETLPTKGWSDYQLQSMNAQRIIEGKPLYVRTYSVSKEILCSLKAKGKAKAIIDLLLRRSEMEKLFSTYLRGIPKSMAELGQTEFVYGNFNQSVARTGRLSSSGPNLQNIFDRVKKYFITRY